MFHAGAPPAGLGGWMTGLLLLALCSCHPAPSSGQAEHKPDKTAAPRLVRTAAVSHRGIERTVATLGEFAPNHQTVLSAKVPGRLREVLVDRGSQVRQGEVIARLEDEDYELRVRQAQAAWAQARAQLGLPPEGENRIALDQTSLVKEARAILNEARAEFQRVTNLAQEGILSQAEVESATAAHQVAQNRYEKALEEARHRQAILEQRAVELEIARKQLKDAVITAPYDGLIQERRASPGDYLTPGSPLAVLVGIHPLRLKLEISERDSPKVKAGQSVRIQLEGRSQTHFGTITRLSPAYDEVNRTRTIEADVPNEYGTLHPGAFAPSEIIVDNDTPVLTIPPQAILSFAGVDKVFRVKDGKALETRVTTGQRTEEWVEITSGLSEAEIVVINPGNLQSGQAVQTTDT